MTSFYKAIAFALHYLHRLGIKTFDYYASALDGLVTELFEGIITRDQFAQMGQQLVEDQLQDAWFEGMGKNGLDIFNMTPEWWDQLNGIIAGEQSAITGFADDIVAASKKEGASVDGMLSRADLYTQRWTDVENQAVLATARAAKTFVWVLGDTEEHCDSCTELDGWVATADEWRTSGIMPQNPPNERLSCGGWRCDCRLEETDAESMGEPSID